LYRAAGPRAERPDDLKRETKEHNHRWSQSLKRKAAESLKKARAALTRPEAGSDRLKTMLAEMKAGQQKREEIEVLPPETFLRPRTSQKRQVQAPDREAHSEEPRLGHGRIRVRA